MIDYATSDFQTALSMSNGDKRPVSFGRRLIGWIEVRQQRKANDVSCVVRIESPHGTVLLTGDLEARGEQELVRREPRLLKADVLLVPHHGSRTSSTPAFIAAVEPDIAVYAAGYRNRFGHPRPDIVARYESRGVRGFRTDLDGALTFTFAPDTAQAPRAEREHDRRYWREAPVREAGKALV